MNDSNATAESWKDLPAHARPQLEQIRAILSQSTDPLDVYNAGLTFISSTTSKDARPLARYPVDDDPDAAAAIAKRAGKPYRGYSGHCSTYCDHDQQQGATVEEHGPWCESPARGLVKGKGNDGERLEVCATLTSRYQHGVYPDVADPEAVENPEYIALHVGEYPGDLVTYLRVGDVLRLAAALQHLAATADARDVPLRAA